MPNWNDPSSSQPNHVNVLKNLADKDTYAVTMGQNTAGYTNLPNGTMNVDNAQKLLRRLEAGSFEVFTLSLAGGGTGANTPAGVRSNINVSETGVGASQVRTNSQNDLRYPLKANALSDMAAGDVRSNINVLEAGTSGSQVRTNTQNDARFVQKTQTATETEAGVVEKATSGEMSSGTANKFPDAATIRGYYGFSVSTTVNSFFLSSATGVMRCSRNGNNVCIRGSISHPSDDVFTILNAVPASFLPNDTVNNFYDPDDSGQIASISISNQGHITLAYRRMDTGARVARSQSGKFTINYPLG